MCRKSLPWTSLAVVMGKILAGKSKPLCFFFLPYQTENRTIPKQHTGKTDAKRWEKMFSWFQSALALGCKISNETISTVPCNNRRKTIPRIPSRGNFFLFEWNVPLFYKLITAWKSHCEAKSHYIRSTPSLMATAFSIYIGAPTRKGFYKLFRREISLKPNWKICSWWLMEGLDSKGPYVRTPKPQICTMTLKSFLFRLSLCRASPFIDHWWGNRCYICSVGDFCLFSFKM